MDQTGTEGQGRCKERKEAESIAQSITSALSRNNANRILEQMEIIPQQFTKDISRNVKNFSKKQVAVSPNYSYTLTKLTGLLMYLLGPSTMPREPC